MLAGNDCLLHVVEMEQVRGAEAPQLTHRIGWLLAFYKL